MNFLITTSLVLCSGLCLAENLPGNLNKITSLPVEQAAELLERGDVFLDLSALASIDKHVAQKLAKFEGKSLDINSVTTIDRGVPWEFATIKAPLFFDGLTSINKGVAEELAKHEGKGPTCHD